MSDDDDDVSAMWRAHREAIKERKIIRAIEWKIITDRSDCKQLSDHHFRLGDWNIWPTTGKFHNQKTGQRGYRLQRFLKLATPATDSPGREPTVVQVLKDWQSGKTGN